MHQIGPVAGGQGRGVDAAQRLARPGQVGGVGRAAIALQAGAAHDHAGRRTEGRLPCASIAAATASS